MGVILIRRKGKPLSPTQRKVLTAVVAVEAVSAAFAYRDLAHRSEEAVRGRKLVWRVVIGLNPGNSLAYWVFGRRRSA